MYSTVVILMLLYGAETLVMTHKHIRAWEEFYQRCLRKILNVCGQDKRTNIDVIDAANSDFIKVMIVGQRTQWLATLPGCQTTGLQNSCYIPTHLHYQE